ncbi:MAG: EAL domain-containing protein [Anaerovibrio sp.]|uniref:EAL domain-containing protein n=1 Tax=Anaerovibrio sp. TaxID=1872532 RepID=UPI001B1E206D|nr:EAL domain-containing protein [Anaerovibrio sp.]MBO6245369.1 EAL domain-containing protein [Anaerovibrio sp.]
MNVEIQICSLIVVLLLSALYFKNRRLQLYKGQLFVGVLLISIINLSLDIISLLCIHYRDYFTLPVTELICKAYLVVLMLETWMAMCYTTCDLMTERQHRRFCRRLFAATLVFGAVAMLQNIGIYDEQGVVYTYGPAVYVTYFYALIMLPAIILCTFIYKKRMNRNRCTGLRYWITALVVAAIIQFVYNNLLLVGFATSLGIIVLFVSLENPELQLDRQYGCFNGTALSEYLNQLLERGEQFVICDISLDNVSILKNKSADIAKIRRLGNKVLGKNPDVLVFNNLDMNIILIAKDINAIRRLLKDYVKYFSGMSPRGMESMISIMPRGNQINSVDDLLKLFSYCRNQKSMSISNNVLFVTEKDVKEFHLIDGMKSEIITALVEDRVEIFLQPIYDIKTGKYSAAEVLVRIRKQNGEYLMPSAFIPVAEANGMIIELGKRVVDKTCSFLADGKAVALGLETVEINLSILQCEQPDLLEDVLAVIARHGIEPNYLCMEVTETASIRSKKLILSNMESFKNIGIRFALDDFGSGQSNFTYLADMPFDILKLDMNLTKSYQVSERARHVIQAVERMAHEMGLSVVAEGVETKEEFDNMRKCGVDSIQGFYFSKPLPVYEFMDFIRRHNSP